MSKQGYDLYNKMNAAGKLDCFDKHDDRHLKLQSLHDRLQKMESPYLKPFERGPNSSIGGKETIDGPRRLIIRNQTFAPFISKQYIFNVSQKEKLYYQTICKLTRSKWRRFFLL
uniref:Uncharacterized protein n=1 Tax=Arundo donax TaxID=35708 RepID=A0A0A9HCW9_ARUDO